MRLKDKYKILRPNTTSREYLSDKGIKCVHYGDIYKLYDYKTIYDRDIINEFILPVKPGRLITQDSLILPDVTENINDFGHIAYFKHTNIPYLNGTHTFAILGENLKYLFYYFQSERSQSKLKQLLHGDTVYQLPYKLLMNFDISDIHESNMQQHIVDIYYVDNDGDGSDSNSGSFLEPFKTIAKAVASIATNKSGIVVLKSDALVTGATNITNGKKVQIISSTVDIEEERPEGQFTITSTTGGAYIFSVAAGTKLSLRDVIIDGRQTKDTTIVYSLINVLGTLEINDGTIITGGHKTSGGSALLLNTNGKIYMYGGEISGNYSSTLASAIGITGTPTGAEIHFLGGKVTNNTASSTGFAVVNNSNIKYCFGGDFQLYNNQGQTVDYSMDLDYTANIYIRDDFTGTIVFYDKDRGYNSVLPGIKYVDSNNNVVTIDEPMDFFNITNSDDSYLHLIHNGTNFSWGYKYEEEVSVVVNPTTENQGILGRKAINNDGEVSSEIYIFVENIPTLPNEAYDFVSYDQAENILVYEYYSEDLDQTFELEITVDLNDPTFEIKIEAPTLESEGLISATSENYPEIIVTQTLPALNANDYLVTNTDEKLVYEKELSAPFGTVSFDVLVDKEDFTYELVTSSKSCSRS